MEGYLGEEKYEAELCKQMARTIADVAKARVKELLVARCSRMMKLRVGLVGGCVSKADKVIV